MTEKRGTFLVTHADDGVAVLADVDDGQVHALSSNPGLEPRDVLEGTVAADPPMEVSWSVVEVERRRRIPVEVDDSPPAERARELADGCGPGELASVERDDGGELHAVGVHDGRAADAAAEIADDVATVRRAARLGAARVEVRAGDGFVGVRYLAGEPQG